MIIRYKIEVESEQEISVYTRRMSLFNTHYESEEFALQDIEEFFREFPDAMLVLSIKKVYKNKREAF